MEYRIAVNFERQKEIIKQLRKHIQDFEEHGLIQGYAFNHYYNLSSEPDTLRIRFDYQNEDGQNIVEKEFEKEVNQLVPHYTLQKCPWDSDEEVLKAYELGSRCAFLFWELMEKGRFSVNYLYDFLPSLGQQSQISLNFQRHFNHGIMNSLGVPKIPQEQIIHFMALLETTGSLNCSELCSNIQKNPLLSSLIIIR